MIDPDAVLQEILSLVHRGNTYTMNCLESERLRTLIMDLDEHMKGGGEVPKRWEEKPLVCPNCSMYQCPNCGDRTGHYHLTTYDYGISRETGYHDAGERYLCKICGKSCDVEDAKVKL
jgi:hypothetical protein